MSDKKSSLISATPRSDREGRAALITGGGTGFGLAIARVLASEGFALTLAGRRAAVLDAAASELDTDVLTVRTDVSDEADVRAVVAAHRDRYGRLDVLVNNAGGGYSDPIEELPTERLDAQLAVNLRAPILFYREAAELLRESSALVVNMASITAKVGQPTLAAYSAAKAGVVALTESMNRELEGVRSTAICPGTANTAILRRIGMPIAAEKAIQPEDVAETVRWLLRLSPACVVSEVAIERRGEQL